jgi:hypothetical protein
MAAGVPFAKLVAVTAEAIAISEPTERSIPPVATTKVIPIATSTVGDTCKSMFRKLLAAVKFRVSSMLAKMSSNTAGLPLEIDVFRHGPQFEKMNLLVYSRYSRSLCLLRTPKLNGSAVELNRPCIGLKSAGQNPEQGRLACAIFSHQRVNFASI